MKIQMEIPEYIPVLIPILIVWWTHRRATRREYRILAGSVLSLCLALVPYTIPHKMIPTFADQGIETWQLPASIPATAAIAAAPARERVVLNFVAMLTGEFMLLPTWIL